jgi:hypothetical protein
MNPNDPHTIMFLATSLLLVGRTKEAVTLGEKLLQIDPLTPMSRSIIAFAKFFEGSMDQAMWEQGTEWLRLEPNNSGALFFNVATRVCSGRLTEASSLIDSYVNPEWNDTYTQLSLLIKYAVEGNTKRIEALLTAEFEKKLKRDTQYCVFVAMFCALAGLNEKALNWLEWAVDREFFNYPFISSRGAIWDGLRGKKRFKELMNRIKYEWEHLDV